VAAKIMFKEIKVEKMEKNSGVFIGSNTASNWRVFEKRQEALSISGENVAAYGNIALFFDNDVIGLATHAPRQRIYTPVRSARKP
jgi:hypothetical protein